MTAPMTISDRSILVVAFDKQHSEQGEPGNCWPTRHGLLQAHRDEAGEEGGLNDGGAVVAAKIIFIVMSENA